MARGAGFPVADVDVGILTDPKIRKLVRQCPDEATAARATIAYLAALLESWGDGERIPVEDAAPLWLTDVDDLRAHLIRAGLVDEQGRVLEHAWQSWYGPALQRRVERQEAGRKGGRAKAEQHPRSSPAKAEPKRSSSDALPDRPTDRTEPTEPTDPSVSELISPKSPHSGDVNQRANGANPRSLGTNPRANAEREREDALRLAEAKAWRQNQRDLAYAGAFLLEEEHRDQSLRDAPLSEIPGWQESRDRIKAEAAL